MGLALMWVAMFEIETSIFVTFPLGLAGNGAAILTGFYYEQSLAVHHFRNLSKFSSRPVLKGTVWFRSLPTDHHPAPPPIRASPPPATGSSASVGSIVGAVALRVDDVFGISTI
jgi:hypothetical protein